MDFFSKVFIICAKVKTVGGSDSILFLLLKGGSIMKKVIFLLIIAFFLAGCTAEWYKHDSVYKTNDHMTFSWWGYNNPDNDDLKKSQKEGWWGEEIPYIPAE